MSGAINAVIEFLNLPQMRALSFLLAAISFILGVLAFKRAWHVARLQEGHFNIDQSRYIQGLWQRANAIVLGDQKYLEWMRELWGYKDEAEVLKAYLIFNQLNPVYTAFLTHHVSESEYNRNNYRADLKFVLESFHKDNREFLMETIRGRGYRGEFLADCEECLANLEREEKSEALSRVGASVTP